MSSSVLDPYVEAADAVGLTYRTGELLLVGDTYVEPVTGRRQCLVEYWDAPSERAGALLLDAARHRWPDCRDLVVRTREPLGPPFRPLLTYLLCEPGGLAPPPAIDRVRVRRAVDGDRDAIVAMLREAIELGSAELGWAADAARVEEVLDGILAADDRLTFVAERDGRVVAHATLLTDARDEPTGRDVVELLDVLVGDGDERAVQALLVDACAREAATRGLPLLGHVVHDAAEPERSARVVAALERHGWRRSHHYEIAALREADPDDLHAPRSWGDPARHLEAAAEHPWYRLCTRLNATVLHATHDFYRARGIEPVLMPVTVSSVSSPMGLGSDSLPVQVELHGERTYLADSMQFQLEFMLRHGLEGAYYVMPTFRGEDPDPTHLNQFFHSEAEIRGGLDDVMRLVEAYVRALAAALLDSAAVDDLARSAGGLGHLEQLAQADEIPSITFDEAADLLGGTAFEDLGGGRAAIRRAGERELIRRFGGIVWLTRPPHLSIPFYQAFTQGTARALSADLLLGVGEVVGCGQRHTDATDLRRALALHEVHEDEYRWYVRMKERYPMETAGFGLGLERFLLFVTGHDDIRDLHVMPRLKGVTSWV